MKIKLILISFLLLVNIITVKALNNIDATKVGIDQGNEIIEEILPVRNNDNKLIGINCIITIPEDYTDKTINLNPDIFGGINEYTDIYFGNININIIIRNNSSYDYKYKLNSLYVSTKKIIEVNNYFDTKVIGFDGLEIYDMFSPYRSYNSALVDLLDGKENLSDSVIDKKLKYNGYFGIEEINKYYLDYYNNKYNLDENNLSSFDNFIIYEMFSGEVSEIKESNMELVKLAYDNFYNNIMFIDINDKSYSIGEYMRSNYNLNIDKVVKRGEFIESKMSLIINKNHFTDVYKNYPIFGKLEFSFERQ